MVKAKVWKKVKAGDGENSEKSDFELVGEELRPINEGEFLAKAMYISIDPCTSGPNTGGPSIQQTQIARIIKSMNDNFPEGKLVVLRSGWRTYSIVDGVADPSVPEPYLLPDMGNISASAGLGVLGVPGNIAYFSFLELCNPKKGETIVVSEADSVVGSIVSQIGKIKGCIVIGITKTDIKRKWLVDDLGLDHSINCNTQDIDEELTNIAKKGVDCYFDNVGGKISNIVYKHLNSEGRIAKSAQIFNGNPTDADESEKPQIITKKNLTVKEFDVYSRTIQWMAGIYQLQTWIAQGKIKFEEHIGEGFENIVDFFNGILKGESSGISIVQVFKNLDCCSE